MKRLRFLYKYILHFLTAKHTRGYGVHSPSSFQFTQFVLYDKSSYYIFPKIEEIRSALKKDKRILNITDFGTGKDRKASVASIASHSLKSSKYGKLLFKIAHYCKSQNILELGTSLGVTTAYLAASDSNLRCVSLEGSEELATIAKENFQKLSIENIQIVVGNIDSTLEKVLNEFEKIDLIFIDANHKLPSVYNYFELCLTKIHNNSVIIIDDIYWSSDMEEAWEKIKNHPAVTSTFDLFQIGIVFFDIELTKKQYKMRY